MGVNPRYLAEYDPRRAAVFETARGDVAQRSFGVLKPDGRAALIISGAQAAKPKRDDA